MEIHETDSAGRRIATYIVSNAPNDSKEKAAAGRSEVERIDVVVRMSVYVRYPRMAPEERPPLLSHFYPGNICFCCPRLVATWLLFFDSLSAWGWVRLALAYCSTAGSNLSGRYCFCVCLFSVLRCGEGVLLGNGRLTENACILCRDRRSATAVSAAMAAQAAVAVSSRARGIRCSRCFCLSGIRRA